MIDYYGYIKFPARINKMRKNNYSQALKAQSAKWQDYLERNELKEAAENYKDLVKEKKEARK